ncbi:type I phosphomannose isomerase catalytic subunit [Silvibacterium dinghuense]|uniref:Mannose-6-phosphate isomerase n=1 Tax=Silvibacterium dinghuense TaxID=1560006 RepID=A0A4Q1SGD3_9BACT|nr:type I phosphomannose isomerase catalytic subunit [Silvibacterium dinghuense]RXS96588.1 mannose-6-phosphate isomerase [Silvibacterium dinghuense]GGG92040.1 mannose-6-phosphate isomerase [Silvibacterium dinghuense]
MSELAPFRLEPYFRTRIWGFHDLAPWYDFHTDGEPIGEVWLTGEMCKVATGPDAGLTLTEITAKLGHGLLGEAFGTGEFPLLIKLLFPKEKLSVQVHPDDALAQKYGEPRGKTECWYALDAQPGAAVALGIKHGVTADEIRASIENSTLEDLLQMVPVSKGDMLYVDAGTVHAMGPGVVILETQQTSDRTYRMYDYGRPRELHIEKSIEAMRLETHAGKIPPQAANGSTILIDEKYFRIERWDVPAGEANSLVTPIGKVQMLFVVDGSLEIAATGAEPFTVGRCQLAVIPADAAGVTVTATSPSSVVRIRPNEV